MPVWKWHFSRRVAIKKQAKNCKKRTVVTFRMCFFVAFQSQIDAVRIRHGVTILSGAFFTKKKKVKKEFSKFKNQNTRTRVMEKTPTTNV